MVPACRNYPCLQSHSLNPTFSSCCSKISQQCCTRPDEVAVVNRMSGLNIRSAGVVPTSPSSIEQDHIEHLLSTACRTCYCTTLQLCCSNMSKQCCTRSDGGLLSTACPTTCYCTTQVQQCRCSRNISQQCCSSIYIQSAIPQHTYRRCCPNMSEQCCTRQMTLLLSAARSTSYDTAHLHQLLFQHVAGV